MTRRRGFSLIEVMISSALFFIGLVAAFTCYSTASQIVDHQRMLTRAIALGEGTLEELVQRFPGDPLIDLGPQPASGPRHYDDDARLSGPGPGGFNVTWSVSLYAKMPGVREMTVTVAWAERGTPKILQFTTWRL